jgi:thiamine biosynthesis lipoprotein
MADPGVTTRTAGGMLRVEQIMGTAVGIDVRDRYIRTSTVDQVFAYLRGVDERFSTYRYDSEINRLARGELDFPDCSPDLRQVAVLCEQLSATTMGFFNARAHRPDGCFDPTGVVKGWAIDEAAWMLDAVGARNFAINAGGDIVTRGQPEAGRGWRVGIRHPERRDRVCVVLEIRNLAVATSANYERDAHIANPHASRPADGLLSFTVVGPSLTYADAYATAGFAMGRDGVAWAARQPGYGAYAITHDRNGVFTPLVDCLIAPPVKPQARLAASPPRGRAGT